MAALAMAAPNINPQTLSAEQLMKLMASIDPKLNPLAAGLNLTPGLKADASNKEIEEAMKRVREAQSLISAAIEPGSKKDDKRKRSRSRSRSRRRRSRSRSRHRRSKSHSRRRSRSRSRRRSKSPRRRRADSRDRSRRSRSRDRRKEEKIRKRSKTPPKSYSSARRSRSTSRSMKTTKNQDLTRYLIYLILRKFKSWKTLKHLDEELIVNCIDNIIFSHKFTDAVHLILLFPMALSVILLI
ncbi:serine/arginine-rich splicing factor [Pimephales promelas]|nr:serine/arginine-rich splicing factor [Pimephales promelas]KAG1941696.1 serine/arginine-rich splicing factor [Pimephales promelas]KAG1941703.1 serine/arginine-rich splicing factor [Pimephales promelas]